MSMIIDMFLKRALLIFLVGSAFIMCGLSAPQHPHKAWYMLTLGNIPIGTVAVSTSNSKTGIPGNYVVRLAHRVGSSPITSEISVAIQNSADQKNVFFEHNEPSSFKAVLNLFPKDFFKIEDSNNTDNEFETRYGRDRFLQTATLKLSGQALLVFKRINKEQYEEETKKTSQNLVDLSLVNELKSQDDEFEELTKNLADCQVELQNLNKSIRTKMPQTSYLIYRRIINFNRFCTQLEAKLNNDTSEDEDKRILLISHAVQNLLKEDAHELPYAVTSFPDRTLFYNNSVSLLWPRITSSLIQSAVKELRDLYLLDLNRKSLLGMQLKISPMQPKAVVRADIIQLSMPVNFRVQIDKSVDMKTSSLEKMPQSKESTGGSASYFLNGVFFARNTDFDLDTMCKMNSGNIGIDLGDIPKTIVNSDDVRGVWNEKTKLSTARLFALKATIAKECRNLYFRSSPSFARFLQAELDTFKTESLSAEHTLLLSNYIQKKLWVMPGRYQIRVFSIVNEKLISVQEFVVGEGTQTNVVANISEFR